ncbi:ParA family protein, partial [Mordavella massiliensis]|nr:ParA family protein [Mordavella massiliensis]
MSATVMSFCNQKGGVGKTSTTALVSYNLPKLGYKTLVIDFDPQANIT